MIQFEAPIAPKEPLDFIKEPSIYLRALEDAGARSGGIAHLDRSEFFRHRKDFQTFARIVEKHNRDDGPLKLLVIGVGNMEEPISLLAVAQEKLGDGKLDEDIDMEIVEIRSRNEVSPRYRLGRQLFMAAPVQPQCCPDSFVLVDGEYEPVPEIKDYLTRATENDARAHFGTPVENYTRTNPGQFDVVCCNNVIQHLGGIEGYSSPYKSVPGEQTHARYYQELSRILNLVKVGGVIFLHAPSPGDKFDTKSKGTRIILAEVPTFNEEFEEIMPAVYRRRTKAEEAS